MLVERSELHRALPLGVPALAFAIMGTGAAGCLLGGALSRHVSSPAVAGAALVVSGVCCLVFPWGSQWLSRVGLSISWLLAPGPGPVLGLAGFWPLWSGKVRVPAMARGPT